MLLTPAARTDVDWSPRLAGATRLDVGDVPDHLGAEQGTRLVVVAAHPDDETIGAGRLVAAWARRVGEVSAVLATAGEACADHVGARPPGLADRRLAEWHAALDVLGVGARTVLGLPDGSLAAYASQVRRAVLREITRFGEPARDPRCSRSPVVVAAPYVDDPHPDHAAAGQAATLAATAAGVPCVGYPVWLTYWGDPADVPGPLWEVAVDADAERAREAALRCFASQLEPLAPGWGAIVPPAMLDRHDRQLLLPDQRGRR